ncbi:MAG TPA: ice-binding family protein [Gemmatimonadaceae bacterium]|nr:ice-binding family protein [Gemmatimonadaceae bacterium]
MKTQSERPLARAVSRRVSAIRAVTFSIAAVLAAACANDTTAPKSTVIEPNPLDPPGVTFITQSNPQIVPVVAVPQSRAYPGTRIAGEATICKDISSPAGSYTFNVQVVYAHINDLVASTATLSPGQCVIIYNRWSRTYGVSPFSQVTITEVIPTGSLYRVDSIAVDDDPTGPRMVRTGQSATFSVNAYHGGYVNFFNAASSTPASPPPPSPSIVDLRSLSTFGILAGTTVTCVTGGTVGGDIGISPGSALTGFGPCTLTGVKHLADGPAAQAQLDLIGAYNNLAGLPCPPANLVIADLGGTTKPAGVYCSASSLAITGVLTLDGGGNPDATFIFQAGSTLTVAGSIVLINGAQAKNVFFQVGSSATLGTGSTFRGNIIALTSITLNDTVTLIGRALARNGAVTLGTGDTIILP